MGKFKMPTVQQYLRKKTIYGKKKDPIWVTLEKEMLSKVAHNKPYNEKVGRWLRFLKDLKYHYFCEEKKKIKRLKKESGPAWYTELSSFQKEVLEQLKQDIHQDLLEDLPRRIRKALSDLGITIKIPKKILMDAMRHSEDPGVFIWTLYKAIYKRSPSELLPKYDINAMILMSSLAFIDLEECTHKLEQLTKCEKVKEVVPKKKKLKYYQPNVKYGEYLQKIYVPLHVTRTNYVNKKTQKSKPTPLGYKFRLRSEESYTALCDDDSFLEKRRERNKKEKQTERVCNYKFWEPPSTLRNTDPKMVAYVNKLRMLKKKARARYKAPYKNVQYLISGVAFTGGRPNYLLANVSLLPTGYIPLNGGLVVTHHGESVTTVLGYWKYPRDKEDKCDVTCDCMTKWEGVIMDYIKDAKCRCGHLYDYNNEIQKVGEKYFYPPTKHGPFWIDTAKVYQMDPMEDFIRDTFRDAMKSDEVTPTVSMPTISASGLKESELLSAFMADLTDTPLLIPHLPESNLLNSLQEWARKRVKGLITPKKHRRMHLKTQRRWLDLKHLDHRARAYRIPFTLKQLENMKWSHRHLVQRLFDILLEDFVYRNRLKQCEQSRLWWATMQYDAYPSKAFLDIFFTYMPGRMKDTHLINPYSSDLTPKCGAKTCPLDT
ncbi:unnamed protein product [Chrysodeixis includens]|uniref:DUF4771 domain-containing protein n=1 Tax=Chrysodeixis includens TaxID=689277 RepID=A0A9N8L4T3_CHRIL|nr:unnamed protein product [Chrysodeixis includens]